MRFFLLILLQLTASTIVFSQPYEIERDPRRCVYKQKYSLKQRLKFYPFNISDSILLVSFRFHSDNYPISKDGYKKDSLIEVKALDKADIKELTDVLFNNFYRKKIRIGLATQCFYPRNAIIFLDKAGLLKEYILICFHCHRLELSSDDIITGDDCTQKMDKLRAFFEAKGLRFGTNPDIENFPGETQYQDLHIP